MTLTVPVVRESAVEAGAGFARGKGQRFVERSAIKVQSSAVRREDVVP